MATLLWHTRMTVLHQHSTWMLFVATSLIVTCSTIFIIGRSSSDDYTFPFSPSATIHYLVDTPSCMIPDIDPFNVISNQTLGDPSPLDKPYCNKSLPMVTDVIDGDTIRINATLRDQLGIRNCEYQQVGDDYEYFN